MRHLTLLISGLIGLALGAGCGRHDSATPPKGPISFNRHVAPLLFTHCAPCHRPGQSAPFALLTFADAKRHAKQMAEVTARHEMPPWLPDGPAHELVGDRRLTEAQIGILRRWVEDGLIEGRAKDLPKAPEFAADWPLGPPDLVLKLPEPYQVPADGPNIYRNFVLPLGTKERRWVRAVDFRPHSAAIHHAMMAFDNSGAGRRWDARDPGPGFASFNMPNEAYTPNHFLGWHPGKQPAEAPRGLSWPLGANQDFILQLHVRPTGKPESVAPEVAFYFTNEPPTNEPLKLALSTLRFAIPPGATNHAVRVSLPVTGDADLLALQPHTHLLAREITGTARFPDGTERVLVHIPVWNFDWQDSYRFVRPVFLPAGTVLELEMTFDNSAANPRNPSSPPRLVRYGLESSDEMVVLNFQVLPRSPAAARQLTELMMRDTARHNLEYNSYLLELDPRNQRAHVGLARALYQSGQLEAAATTIARARELEPRDDDAALVAGLIAVFRQRPAEARAAFEDCVRLNPNHQRAHGCLGTLAMEQGWPEVAERHLREALRIDPADATAKEMLRRLGVPRPGP